MEMTSGDSSVDDVRYDLERLVDEQLIYLQGLMRGISSRMDKLESLLYDTKSDLEWRAIDLERKIEQMTRT